MERLTNLVKRLSKADIVFYLMPALILLLLAGTIAQKYMGLYAAHKMFFASFIFFAGPVPLPGGYLILGIITFCLALNFFFHSEWRWVKAGIHLSHLGALVLLGGGLLTALYAKESYMVIPEGETSPYIYDYVQRELVISSKNSIQRIAYEDLDDNPVLVLPFSIDVIDQCDNCEIKRRAESDQDFGDLDVKSLAGFMALHEKMPAFDPEENLTGLTFKISGAGDDQDGIYIAFDAMPRPIVIERGGQTYSMIFGKAQRQLPFAIQLKDFEKQSYAGTDKAREYISDLVVIDGGVEWPARIAMNEPLRYKGYTFYQSSFERTEDGELSILSVVENKGRLFPYIGTIIIALGLIMHMLIVTGIRGRP